MSSHLINLRHEPEELVRDFAGCEGLDILKPMISEVFAGRIALVSSFGVDSAVLLHMVARIDAQTPVLFLDTGRLFAQTHDYQKDLTDRLGLKDVRILRPEPKHLAEFDSGKTLAGINPAVCCFLRKVLPLRKGLRGFDAWITGRKSYQTGDRRDLAIFERDGEHVKINPLAAWRPGDVRRYIQAHDLPEHALLAQGFPSIGCLPCTTPVSAGEDARAGRWRGQGKDECGIHFVNGRAVRAGEPVPEGRPARAGRVPRGLAGS